RCAAEQSNELAPFHRFLPLCCSDGPTLVPRRGTAPSLPHPRASECSPHLTVKATSLVDVRKGEGMTNKRQFVCAFAASAATVRQPSVSDRRHSQHGNLLR